MLKADASGVLIFAAANAKSKRVRKKLKAEFRQIAVARIPSPKDPRFSNWDPAKIFPPGRWGELELKPGELLKPVKRRRTSGSPR